MPTHQSQLTLNDTILSTVAFQATEEVLFRQIEEEAVLLHVTNGNYYSLNETSLPFWEALQNQQPLTTAIDQITDSYAVERDQVLADLQTFLTHLLSYNLITQIA
ncbi:MULTISPECIES: PqqD family protein [Cyanophyceae]|uniref:PqqD family protein n=1 Tax=Leptolyngbya subtilissima DQ-A4 TaxID=2933933 RepID=A0ABV0JZ20_9CYAN|nr:PqqD family protein [Nodosilinea sp. FACHB-141]MBD2112403.1 PqqD family protein [Nodosilinea sp. FACHB-141]